MGGVAVGEGRINAIQELPTPACIYDLRSVLGVMNSVRWFVPNYAKITAPLVDLARKDFATCPRCKKAWGNVQDTAFPSLSNPSLTILVFQKSAFVLPRAPTGETRVTQLRFLSRCLR